MRPGSVISRRLPDVLWFVRALALIAAGLGWGAGPAAAQVDLVGTVRDSASNEVLPNVLVSVDDHAFRAFTNEFGRFVLIGLPAETNRVLRVEHLGYETREIALDADAARELSVLLVPRAIEIDGVTVTATTATDIVARGEAAGQIALSPQRLGTLPSLGETDVFRALQLLPGVSGTNDATSGLFVRGGTPDENLVLLDGMTVYHVDHFFGVFSAFNPDAVQDVRLFKGGFPAQYGGRTSSVVEMVGKSGNPEEFRMSGGLSLLSARAVTEVPLGGKGSWLVSARRSYTDLMRTGLYNDIFGTLEGADDADAGAQGPGGGFGGGGFGRFGNFQQQTFEPDFYFYDLNSKLTFLPTSEDVLTLSVYGGEDRLDKSTLGQEITTPAGDTRLTADRADLSNWGNRGVSGRWARQWGSRLATDALVAYSQYFSEATLDVASSQFARGFDEDNRVKDLTARLDNTWRPFPSSEIGFGAQFTRSDVAYALTRLRGDSAQTLNLDGESNLTAGYVQHSWTPSARVDLTAGLRMTSYDGTGQRYWEPRASARYSLTDQLSLTGAWGRYNQFVKRVENEDILEGSRDFWILAGDNIAPSSAEHWIAGIAYETDDYLFDVEAYARDLGGVAQFSTRSRRAPGQRLAELFFEGTGTARGIELLAQKKRGALTGWLGYTLANVEHELEGFNDGLPFPASHDQRHEVKAVGSYQLGRWTLTGGWVYGSGRPYTVPEAQYPITLLDGRTLSYIHVGAKNGERLPAYHRLDLAASRRFEVGEFYYELNLSLFNVYGRNNVWYRQFDLTDLPMLVTDVTTLGFTPSIGLRAGLR